MILYHWGISITPFKDLLQLRQSLNINILIMGTPSQGTPNFPLTDLQLRQPVVQAMVIAPGTGHGCEVEQDLRFGGSKKFFFLFGGGGGGGLHSEDYTLNLGSFPLPETVLKGVLITPRTHCGNSSCKGE